MRVGPIQVASSRHSASLSMYMPKGVGDKGHRCLRLILQLISCDQPSIVRNMAIMFPYKLIKQPKTQDEALYFPNFFKWLSNPSGYGWPPNYSLAQNTFLHLGIFSTIFWVLNFWGHFEALNDVFLTWQGPRWVTTNTHLDHCHENDAKILK